MLHSNCTVTCDIFLQFGTFQHNAALYVIQPSSDSDVRGEGHIVSRLPNQDLVFESLSPRGNSVFKYG